MLQLCKPKQQTELRVAIIAIIGKEPWEEERKIEKATNNFQFFKILSQIHRRTYVKLSGHS